MVYSLKSIDSLFFKQNTQISRNGKSGRGVNLKKKKDLKMSQCLVILETLEGETGEETIDLGRNKG